MARLVLEHIPPDNWYRRTYWRVHQTTVIGGYMVPKGFITDGATTPRIIWSVFPPMGRYACAAVVHDYLLSIGCTRDFADMVFDEQLAAHGVVRWRKKVMYTAVSLFGKVKTRLMNTTIGSRIFKTQQQLKERLPS